jgi:GNAT superfamily N-acetyltransferase
MIEYVEGKRDDLLQILELYKQLNPSNNDFTTDEANKIWDKIEINEIKYFVGKQDGMIIASCYISIIPNLTFNGKSIGFIENVITDEKYRRQGIGKKVIEMAIEYAKKENCYKVVLQSGIKRTTAHKFYEAIGFNGESKKAFEMRF